MEEMTIRLNSLVEKDGHIRARLRADAPDAGIRIWVEVKFKAPENTDRAD